MKSIGVILLAALACHAEPVKLGPVSAEPPKEWVSEKLANRLRSAQFKLKTVDEGFADGEVMVMPESKSDPEKVFPGWKGQFEIPEGKTVEDISNVSKFEAGPATVHLLDMHGTWKYRERPNDPKSKLEKRDDYRVVWAIVVVKDEATHVRLSGPKRVTDHYYDGFEKWLKSLK